MSSKEQQEKIIQDLEMAYAGAKALDDTETMLRIDRAIVAFKADLEEEIFIKDFGFEQYMGEVKNSLKELGLKSSETAE